MTLCHLPYLCLSVFANASTFSFLIFNFHHAVKEFCSSCEDTLLSVFVLVHQVSCYSLNLDSDAENCLCGERRGNALDKMEKGTNSAPYPKLGVQKFSSGQKSLFHYYYSSLLCRLSFSFI